MGQISYTVDAITRKMMTSDPDAVIVEDDNNATHVKFSVPDLLTELAKTSGVMPTQPYISAYVYHQHGDVVNISTCEITMAQPQMFNCIWKIPYAATMEPGKLRFQLCVTYSPDGVDWNSMPETLDVIDGINHLKAIPDGPALEDLDAKIELIRDDVLSAIQTRVTKDELDRAIKDSVSSIVISTDYLGSENWEWDPPLVRDAIEIFLENPTERTIACRVKTATMLYDAKLYYLRFNDQFLGTYLQFECVDPLDGSKTIIMASEDGTVRMTFQSE